MLDAKGEGGSAAMAGPDEGAEPARMATQPRARAELDDEIPF